MDIPTELFKIVSSFLVKPKMKLLDWIPAYKLCWRLLSENPNAIHLLSKNPDAIFIQKLSANPNAIHMLEAILQDPILRNKINWENLSSNPNATHILKKYPKKIKLRGLSRNPDLSFAIPMLEKVLQRDPDKINKLTWYHLSANPSAIQLLTHICS